jgi:predicted Zn-dependent protease
LPNSPIYQFTTRKALLPVSLLLLGAAAALLLWPRLRAPQTDARLESAALSALPTDRSGIRALLEAHAAARTQRNAHAVRERYAALLKTYGFLPAARREYADLLRLFPGDPALVRALADVRRTQGQAEEAANLLMTVAGRAPQARLEAARCFLLAGEAARCLQTLAEETDRENPERLRLEVAAWLDRGQPEKAAPLLEPLTRRVRTDAEARLLLLRAVSESAALPNAEGGRAVRLSPETQAGILALEAHEAQPSDRHRGRALYEVGRIAERNGDPVSAARAYRQAAEADPRLSRAYLHLARILERERGRSPEMRAAALRFRGLYERAENNPRGAAAAFAEALRLNPRSLQGYLDLSDSLLQQNRPQEAIAVLRRGLKVSPAAPECWIPLVVTYSDWNRPAEALAAAREFARVAGPRALGLARVLEGRAYLKAGDAHRAVEAFRQANQAAPGAHGVHYWLGAALLEGATEPKRAEEAAAYLQQAVRAAPESVDAWMALGSARLRAGAADRAAEALERALEMDPARAEGYALLAQALRAQAGRTKGERQRRADAAAAALALYGELDAAVKRERSLVRAVERAPADPAPRLALAQHYLETGNLEAARRIYLPAIRWGEPPAAVVRKFRELENILGIPHT